MCDDFSLFLHLIMCLIILLDVFAIKEVLCHAERRS